MGSGVAVIIVNYGTAGLAIEAVASVLERHHDGRPVTIHLVDNGSPGDDAAVLRDTHARRGWSDRVVLHLETVNHGFGRGNNLVLTALSRLAAPPAYVFLLNPDARLDGETIALLATFLDAHPQAAAAGTTIVRPGGQAVPSAFHFPDLRSEFTSIAGLGMLARKSIPAPGSAKRQAVDWVSGAATMIRLETLRGVGFFDPDFFLYFEETELMLRLRRAGHSVWHVPEARVIHIAGAATGMQAGRHRSNARPGYWYDSWRLYHLKAGGKTRARAAALAHLAGAAVNGVLRRVRQRPSQVPDRFLTDFGRHVLRPLFLGDPYLTSDSRSAIGGDRP